MDSSKLIQSLFLNKKKILVLIDTISGLNFGFGIVSDFLQSAQYSL